jgi:hypothetical protein
MKARTHLRRFAALAGRAAPAAAALAPSPTATAPAGVPAPRGGAGGVPALLPAGVLAPLKAIAKNAAQAYGDWRPAQVTVVPTTHARARPAVTPRAPSAAPRDTPVYLVTMTGHFTGRTSHGARRPGTPGRHLSLVIDARSFWVMDTTLSRRPPPVPPAALGPPTSIAW